MVLGTFLFAHSLHAVLQVARLAGPGAHFFKKSAGPASKILHFVSLTESFLVSDAKLLKSCM